MVMVMVMVMLTWQVMDIRRQNMMMSDHGIHSRDRLLVPVTKKEFLEGKECYVEMDAYARREVAVLYPDGMGQNRKPSAAMQRYRVYRKLGQNISQGG